MAVEKNTPFIYSIPLWLPADYNHWLSFCLNSFFALFLYSFFSIHHASHKKKIITISIKINQLTFYVYVRRLWNGASLSDPNVTVPNCMYMWCLILICYNIYICACLSICEPDGQLGPIHPICRKIVQFHFSYTQRTARCSLQDRLHTVPLVDTKILFAACNNHVLLDKSGLNGMYWLNHIYVILGKHRALSVQYGGNDP